jgi:hypothetical protein
MVNGIAALDQAEGVGPEAPGEGRMPGGMPDQNVEDIINMLMGPQEQQEEENVRGDVGNDVETQEENQDEEDDEDEDDIAVCDFSFP